MLFSYDNALRVGSAFLLVDGTDETIVRVAEIALFPNRVQSRRLERLLDLARESYNAALQERREAWRLKRHSVTLFDQFGQITELRELRPEIKVFGIQPIRGALRRVDHGLSAFFRRCATGDKPGYPRFKSRRRYRSIDYDEPIGWKIIDLDGERPRVRIQGIGEVRIGAEKARQLRRLIDRGGETRTLRLVKLASGCGWHACVGLRDVQREDVGPASETIAGIDRGIANTLALPDGTLLRMPRFLDDARGAIAELQRQRSLTKPGSSEYRVLSRRIAKLHRKVKNRSLDWARHVAGELVGHYGVLVIEKLELKNMVRSAKGSIEQPGKNVAAKSGLNRSLHEAALSQLAICICVKAEGAGRRVWAVPAANSSRECAACGHTAKANRPSQAVFACIGLWPSPARRRQRRSGRHRPRRSRGDDLDGEGLPVRARPKPRLRRTSSDSGAAVAAGAGPAPHAERVA